MLYQEEAMDEVDGAPLDRMAEPAIRLEKQKEFMKKEHDSGFGSLSSNPSGFGSLGSNQSLTADLNRLNLAEKVFSNGKTNSLVQSSEEGYVSMTKQENVSETSGQETVLMNMNHSTTAEQTLLLFSPDNEDDTQLHLAIIQGQTEIAQRIIDLAPTVDDVNRPNAQRLTPLHLAVLTDQTQLVRHLLGAGGDLETRDEQGNTPLHLACYHGKQRCVQALTQPLTASQSVSAPFQQIPQDMDIKNYDGNTCMHLAAQQSHLETLAYLYGTSVGADVNAGDGLSGRTVLHWAADNGNADLVALLVSQSGTRVHASAYNKCTPVQLAMGRGHVQVIEQLVTAGACLELSESSSESDSSEDGMMEEHFDDFRIYRPPASTMCT